MRLDDGALGRLFLEAKTNRAWLPKDVPDSLLREVVELMKMGPTAFNCLPARIVYVKSTEAKERLKPHLSSGNVDKTMKAPATAIIAYDLKFYEHPPKGQDKRSDFGTPEAVLTAAMRNGSLQGGYFMIAARALGLDVGPMSGFNNAGVDAEFFAGTDLKSNFLCNVGYGDPVALRPRGPRFAFEDMAKII
ncbi:MAG: malonic semialdehyde reductase [Hyphomicrobiaceae bacterium]